MRYKTFPVHKVVYDDKGGVYEFGCYPKKSTLDLQPYHRAIGRMASIVTTDKPVEAPGFFDLGADLFESFYFPEVAPLEGDAIPEERELTAMIMQWFRAGLEASGFQGETYDNVAAASAAAGAAWTYLTQDETIRKILELQQQLEDLLKQYGDQEGEGDGEGGEGDGQGEGQSGQGQGQSAGQKKLKEVREKIAKLTGKIAQDDYIEQTLRGKVAQAAQEGAKEGEATRDLTEAVGWGHEDGSESEVDIRPIMDFMKKHKHWIGALVKAIGRARRTALRAAAYSAPTPHPIATGAYTQDLPSIHPQELALLVQDDEAFALMAMLDFMDRGLFGWEQKADKREDGYFTMAVDVSGSMGGQEFIIATAVALGLALAARDKKREYSLYKFDTRITAKVNSTQDYKEHLKWTASNSGGGTEFDPPLERMAQDIESALEKRQGDSMGMDAVIVSDGYAKMSKKIVERWDALKKLGVRLMYIAVGDGTGVLNDLSNKVLELHKIDLENGDAIAAAVGKWLAD